MDYKVKLVIDGTEVFEQYDLESTTPSASNIQLKDSTSLNSMGIGATASNALYFTLNNPFKASFDGSIVEMYIQEGDEDGEYISELDDEAEGIISDCVESDDDYYGEEEEDEEEEATEEDEAEAEEEELARVDAFYDLLEGETVTDSTEDIVEDVEWLKIGVFNVLGQKDDYDGKSTRLEALDNMAMISQEFVPTVQETSVQTLYNDLKSQLATKGYSVEDFDFSSFTDNINWIMQMSFRDAIGIFAGLVGGYAMADRDGVISIDFYTLNDNILIKEELLSWSENASSSVMIDGIKCDTSINAFDESWLVSGSEDCQIEFANPFMKQSYLDEIYERYHGFMFSGASIKSLWNDDLNSGEFIRVMSANEYINYVGLQNAYESALDLDEKERLRREMVDVGTIVLISNQTIDFTGEATTTIDSVTQSDIEKTALIDKEWYRAFKNIYAEKIKAERIDVDDLCATMETIGNPNGWHIEIKSASICVYNRTTLMARFTNDSGSTIVGRDNSYVSFDRLDNSSTIVGESVWIDGQLIATDRSVRVSNEISNVSRQSGASIDMATLRQFGKYNEFEIHLKYTTSVASGSDIFVAKLNKAYLFPQGHASAVAYYGNHAIVGMISINDSDECILRVRNASDSAVTISNGIHLQFNYIQELFE